MPEDPEVYYFCGDCIMSFVKDSSNRVYVEATTDHASCLTCGATDVFVCRVYPDEPVSGLTEEPDESCPKCRYVTVTDDTLFKARKAIMRVFPSEEAADKVINELLNDGLLIRERI